MEQIFQYRISKIKKNEIAQNLIDILQNDTSISLDTKAFIANWLLTGHTEKRKAFYDIWDIVLRNYLPATRPVLFRACTRISKIEKISSFTGRLECARRISEGKGSLIICDTSEALKFEEELYRPGYYKHTFYPLVDVLIKVRDSGSNELSEWTLDFIGEDEYIMKIHFGNMYGLKWQNIKCRKNTIV
jgi:hypothetical protein